MKIISYFLVLEIKLLLYLHPDVVLLIFWGMTTNICARQMNCSNAL